MTMVDATQDCRGSVRPGSRPMPPVQPPHSRLTCSCAGPREFQAALYDAGYAGITWPKEVGGQGLGTAEQQVFSEVAAEFENEVRPGAERATRPGNAGHPLDRMRGVNEVALLLHELPVPSVAKVDGVAVGAGWNLALGCDLVVCTPGARFSQIFAKRGLSLDFGGSWLLPKLVGLQQAKRLALLAEMIDAAEAHRLGLVTWVVEPEEIDAFVTDLGKRLAAGPPVAIAQSKALLNEGADRTMRDALASEARTQTINFATADAPAAFEAFMAKTDPVFTGEWSVR